MPMPYVPAGAGSRPGHSFGSCPIRLPARNKVKPKTNTISVIAIPKNHWLFKSFARFQEGLTVTLVEGPSPTSLA